MSRPAKKKHQFAPLLPTPPNSAVGMAATTTTTPDVNITGDSSTTTSSISNNQTNGSILDWDLYTLRQALSQHRVTCLQLMEATLDRIDAQNPTYNAIILLQSRDKLLQQAQEADQVPLDKRSFLHGIPMAIKDLSHVKGIPTTFGGSPLVALPRMFDDNNDNTHNSTTTTSTTNDDHVQRLLAAGVIVIGKTNTPEHGVGSHTYNNHWGPTRNAVSPTKSAGGSSGGAAVAVATKMLVVADGSDMMGSLRNPAGWNGLYSHRPTACALLESGEDDDNSPPTVASLLPFPISMPGPLARTPLDCAILLDVMVEKEQRKDSAKKAGKNQQRYETTLLSQSPNQKQQIRIGWLGDWGGTLPMEAGILEACEQALQLLQEKIPPSSGTSLQVINDKEWRSATSNSSKLFSQEALWTNWNLLRYRNLVDTMTNLLQSKHVVHKRSLHDLFDETGPKAVKGELQWELKQGLQVTQEELHEAVRVQHEFLKFLEDELFTRYDVLALPSAQLWPFPVEWKWPHQIINHQSKSTQMDTYHRWMEVCVPVSFGGLPCTTIPVVVTDNNMAGPLSHKDTSGSNTKNIGIQLIGPRHNDEATLRLANLYFHHC